MGRLAGRLESVGRSLIFFAGRRLEHAGITSLTDVQLSYLSMLFNRREQIQSRPRSDETAQAKTALS